MLLDPCNAIPTRKGGVAVEGSHLTRNPNEARWRLVRRPLGRVSINTLNLFLVSYIQPMPDGPCSLHRHRGSGHSGVQATHTHTHNFPIHSSCIASNRTSSIASHRTRVSKDTRRRLARFSVCHQVRSAYVINQ